jgi:hypothetical protein
MADGGGLGSCLTACMCWKKAGSFLTVQVDPGYEPSRHGHFVGGWPLTRLSGGERHVDDRRHVACESLTVGGQCFVSSACVISAFRTCLGTCRSFQQRKPPGLEQRHDRVDLGLWCGIVRVRPQDGSGVVQAVELVCGFCHAAT